MDRAAVFEWLLPRDRQVFRELVEAAPTPTGGPSGPGEHPGARAAIAAAAPVWLTASGIIILARLGQGRRPLLLFHDRVGLHRAPLWVPKIPTMVVPGNERVLGGIIERASGPPVDGDVETAFERWLRQSGLDELPQLALVALGKMRLVGPRPVTATEIAEMEEGGRLAIDRLAPGLLGVWQLLDREAYTLEERRALDAWMVDHWCGHLERRIIWLGLRQAWARLRGRP